MSDDEVAMSHTNDGMYSTLALLRLSLPFASLQQLRVSDTVRHLLNHTRRMLTVFLDHITLYFSLHSTLWISGRFQICLRDPPDFQNRNALT